MEEVQHESVVAWHKALTTAQKKRKPYLVKLDDPKRRMFGFIDHKAEKHHLIGFTKMRATIHLLPDDVREALREPKDREKMIEGEA